MRWDPAQRWLARQLDQYASAGRKTSLRLEEGRYMNRHAISKLWYSSKASFDNGKEELSYCLTFTVVPLNSILAILFFGIPRRI